jgi:hypothetical protein
MPLSNRLAKSRKGPPTSSYVDIAEIRDDSVIMKDGTLRGVLLTSSVNFSLKSEDEQTATIQAYMQFLNSLDFPLQIVIQSRKLNIDAYLKNLADMEKQQTNELLRVQISEYLNYIKELISLGDIMTKRFYIVVPYSPASDKQRSPVARFLSAFSAAKRVQLNREEFERYSDELSKRCDYVATGLNSIGLKAIRLDTQGLIELYYTTYSPELKDQQPMVDMDKLQVDRTSASLPEATPSQ